MALIEHMCVDKINLFCYHSKEFNYLFLLLYTWNKKGEKIFLLLII